jgi:hypothetical protein
VPQIDPHLDSRTSQQPRSPALIPPHVQTHRARRRGSSTTAVLDSVWGMAVPVLAHRRGDHDNHPGACGSEGYLWGCDLGVLGPWGLGMLAPWQGTPVAAGRWSGPRYLPYAAAVMPNDGLHNCRNGETRQWSIWTVAQGPHWLERRLRQHSREREGPGNHAHPLEILVWAIIRRFLLVAAQARCLYQGIKGTCPRWSLVMALARTRFPGKPSRWRGYQGPSRP